MRLIFSFTTTPTRISKIEPMIKSILNQSRKADKIIINLPNEYIRDKNTLIIPDFISYNNKITINRCNDYGPGTKLVGILNNDFNLNNNDYIISVDDDICYNNNLLIYYEKFINLNKNNVYGLSGFIFNKYNNMVWQGEKNIIKKVDGLEGWASICYPYKFLKKDIISQIKDAPKYLLYSDDVLLSNYFNKKTKLILINTPAFNRNHNTTLKYGEESDALHKLKGDSTHFLNYKNSVEFLKKKNNLHMTTSLNDQLIKTFLSKIFYLRSVRHKWRKH